MTIQDTSTTPQGVLDAARDLAPTIAERVGEIEDARRLPRDLLDELVRAGCFRLLVPRSHGGLGADLPAAMRVVETSHALNLSSGGGRGGRFGSVGCGEGGVFVVERSGG
jgi:alkylation response protein AidB-like acyl-CoA dehydrogenase